jgi:hypothetical protein
MYEHLHWSPVFARGSGGKKNRQKERRLMKGFNLASMGQPPATGQTFSNSSIHGLAGGVPGPGNPISTRTSISTLNEQEMSSGGGKGSRTSHQKNSPMAKLARLARLAGAKKSNKNKWGNLIEAARSAKGVARIWNRSRSDDSVSSEGSTASHPTDDMNGSRRRERYAAGGATRPGSHSRVNVTENELPEVLEESGIDYELSGRMGMMEGGNAGDTTISSVRCFRRARSEPADHVTLILESSQLGDGSENAEAPSHIVSAVPVLMSSTPWRSNSDSNTSPGGRSCNESSRSLRDTYLMSSLADPASEENPTVESSQHKSFNGTPSATSLRGSTSSYYDRVPGVQPVGRHNTGGWL